MEWEASEVPGELADMVISEISNCNGKLNCKRPTDPKSSKEASCSKALCWVVDVCDLQHVYLWPQGSHCELFWPDIVHMWVAQHVQQEILDHNGLLDGGSGWATTAVKEVLHLHQCAN
jgi:hypothetical protein